MRSRAARVAGWCISIACLGFFVLQAHRSFSGDFISLSGFSAAWAVAGAMAPYMCAYFALAGAWLCLLKTLGMRPSWRCAMGIYFSTQIAKYLPGNIGQHIGRVYLSASHGLPAFRIGLSLAIEMLLIIAVAAFLSIPLVPLLLEGLDAGIGTAVVTVAVLGGCAIGALYLLRRSVYVSSARHHLVTAVTESRLNGSLRYLAPAIVLVVLALAFVGFSLLTLGLDLQSIDAGTLLKAIAVVSASWVLGFLTPGAPAGLGVREAILLAGLSTIIDRHTAFQTTILFRGVSVAADLLALAIGAALLRSIRPRSPSH